MKRMQSTSRPQCSKRWTMGPTAQQKRRPTGTQDELSSQNRELDKLRGELDAERVENTLRSKAIVDQSKELITLRGELATERDKTVALQETIAKQSWDLVDSQDKLSLEAEKSRNLERRSEELKLKVQKCEATLQGEEETTLCVICFERPRKAFCLPCLHLYYCSQCLEDYLKRNKACPSCRTASSGFMKCR